jgi:hypothetical protein
MRIAELLSRLRAHGGAIRLAPRGGFEVRRGRMSQPAWEALKKCLAEHRTRVLAELREERAARYWEASGKNPFWYRTYERSRTRR